MGLIFNRKKDKEEKKKNEPMPIEYRISGFELMRLLVITTILVMIIAWLSFLLISLLYFLSFASVLLLLLYGYELMQKRGYRYGKKMFIPIAGAMFFLALSLSPNNLVFLISAYGSGIFSPLLGYKFLCEEIEKSNEMKEEFGYV